MNDALVHIMTLLGLGYGLGLGFVVLVLATKVRR